MITPRERLDRRLYFFRWFDDDGNRIEPVIDKGLVKTDEGSIEGNANSFNRVLVEAPAQGHDILDDEEACWEFIRETLRRGWVGTVAYCGYCLRREIDDRPVNVPGDIEAMFGL